MAFDANAEIDALMTFLSGYCGGRVYEEGEVDEGRLAYYTDNPTKVKPYIVVSVGEPYDSERDRSIGPESQQPMLLPFQIKLWAGDAVTAREAAGELRVGLRGRALTANSSPIRLGGGGSFAPNPNVGESTRYLRLITCETLINMQVEIVVPAP